MKHSGRVTPVGATPLGRPIWQAACGCDWVAPNTNMSESNARRALKRHLEQAQAEPRAPFFQVTVCDLPIHQGERYELRRDPAQITPDHVVHKMGEVHHLVEFGHPAAVGCCPSVDQNGRHLLPQHRRPA